MVLNEIYHGDCISIMNTNITSESIPLIFADPPYNLSGKVLDLAKNTTGGAYYKVNEKWDTYTYEDYLLFCKQWIQTAYEKLTSNGSMYISCTHHNIGEIITTARQMGLKLNNILTWYKVNAMPNITKRTFTHATEFICWFVKGQNWIFNYEVVKSFNPHRTKKGETKQMRDFLDFIELPIVQGKERIKLAGTNRAAHPTQKPEKLLELIILASSNEGDVVLDPFFGTGTTGVVAQRLNRNWIGIENCWEYVQIAKKRIYEYSTL
ncbi:DNA-methyltransferase [Raineya orbicola]|uniref:Methyltransferase n=1 Tax=Raineya orbicola TaxID=2016530 RepID=A0A2N3IIV3_9BACT|nr:site-specific DNA-methyltransferase [Raineya orbicola]PKQ70226.1 DNA modification methylase [Raineya orbicola]